MLVSVCRSETVTKPTYIAARLTLLISAAYTCASPNKLSEDGPGEGGQGEAAYASGIRQGEAAYASGMDLLLLATLAEQAETKRDRECAEWRRDCV